jgi:hypothetical protein
MAAITIGLVLLLLAAGYVAFAAVVIMAFGVGNRGLALLALLVAGLGVLCGIVALALARQGQPNRSLWLIGGAFLIVIVAFAGVFSIPTHGE